MSGNALDSNIFASEWRESQKNWQSLALFPSPGSWFLITLQHISIKIAIFLLLKLLLTSNFTVRHRHRQRQIYDDNQSRMWTMLSLHNSGSGSVNLTLVGITYSDFFFGKIMSRKSVWSWAWMNFTQKLIKVLNYNKMINSREWNHFSTRILPGVFGQTSTCQSFFVSTSPYQRACCGNLC